MTKYFMKGTDDEVQFGDLLELDFTKENEDGKMVHHHMECKFVPELLDMLLDNDIIDIVDDEEEGFEEEELDLTELQEAIDEMAEQVKALSETIGTALKSLSEAVNGKPKKPSKK